MKIQINPYHGDLHDHDQGDKCGMYGGGETLTKYASFSIFSLFDLTDLSIIILAGDNPP